MKLYDKKRIRLIGLSILSGIIFTAYILYEQTGELGKNELIILGVTLGISILISVIMIKTGNKE